MSASYWTPDEVYDALIGTVEAMAAEAIRLQSAARMHAVAELLSAADTSDVPGMARAVLALEAERYSQPVQLRIARLRAMCDDIGTEAAE